MPQSRPQVPIEIDGVSKTPSTWSQERGLGKYKVRDRLRDGWHPRAAVLGALGESKATAHARLGLQPTGVEANRRRVAEYVPPPKQARLKPPRARMEAAHTLDRALDHEVLTEAEERAVFERYAAARAEFGKESREAIALRNEIVQRNVRLTVMHARRYGSDELEDRVSDGVIGLIRAAEDFDPSRGCRFATFAKGWIRHHMRRSIDNTGRVVRVPVHALDKMRAGRFLIDGVSLTAAYSMSMDTHVMVGGESVRSRHEMIASGAPRQDDLVDGKHAVSVVRSALGKLKPRERLVLTRMHGLDGDDEETSHDIARREGMTGQGVRWVRESALAKMRRAIGDLLQEAV